MYYEIIANRFAPKRADLLSEPYSCSHSVCYGKCNFDCCFCDFRQRPESAYQRYSNEAFEQTVNQLLTKGKNFKFTGGEPTLNPDLERHLEIVKAKGGYVYLDSNGSRPDILERLIEKRLIDVLGISLKGITPQEAQEISRIKRRELCWDHVWETLKMASAHRDHMRTIVTLVFTEENRPGRLHCFAQLLKEFPGIYMKINNLQRDDHPEEFKIHSVNREDLFLEIQTYVEEYPQWKGRTIYVPGEDGVSEYSALCFF